MNPMTGEVEKNLEGARINIDLLEMLQVKTAGNISDQESSMLTELLTNLRLNYLDELKAEMNLTCLFVAHDLSVVRHICDRVAVMYAGKIVEMAPAEELFSNPLHPYTRALISAVPHPDPDVKMNFRLGGEVADPANLPPGCSFSPRCDKCIAPCKKDRPELQEVTPGRFVACHLHGDANSE